MSGPVTAWAEVLLCFGCGSSVSFADWEILQGVMKAGLFVQYPFADTPCPSLLLLLAIVLERTPRGRGHGLTPL